MNKLKVIKVDSDGITFDNNVRLYSTHDQDCCEHHELTFSDLTLQDFEELEFDLTNDNFFKRIEGYGIELVPIKGHSVKIPGHGSNNGYYGTNIDLVIDQNNKTYKIYDVSECQVNDKY
jgi:hypothetical protein